MDGKAGALMTLDTSVHNSNYYYDTTPTGYSQSVQILASGATPGVLEPGESETVPVYYAGWLHGLWDFSRPPITFSVTTFTSDDAAPIDWASLQQSLRPASISTAAWNAIYPNVTSEIGTTWGTYVSSLDIAATFLGYMNQSTYDVSKLWQYEIENANDGAEATELAWTQDLQPANAGLSLAAVRAFNNTITARGELGPFGVGWTWANGWGQILTTLPNGSIEITAADGSVRVYSLQPFGGYVGLINDGSTLAKSAGTYTLREQNGELIEFGSDGSQTYIQDAAGNTVTAGYTNGLLTSLADSTGQSLLISYNPAGRIQAIASSDGQTAIYSYDPTNTYLTGASGPGGTTTYTYGPATGAPTDNALLSVTFPRGLQNLYAYDSQGRLNSFESGYTVAGQITDGNGAALSGATATLYLESNPKEQFTATTQADGSYLISGVRSGTYDLVVLLNGFQASVKTGITVSGPTAGVSVTLQPSTTMLTGTVVDSTGEPIGGATVDVIDGAGRTIVAAVSVSDGSFVITTASGNNLLLQVQVPGSNAPTQQTISIVPGTTVQLGPI
ncbi:MAG: carboxypeptidase regulatory-like domain-containing protein, partial [Pirellulales bacterium]